MIQETVEASLQQGLTQLRTDMASQAKNIGDMQQCIVNAEDYIQEGQSHTQTLENTIQLMADNIDDSENRSKRNNLRIIGLPETYKMANLQRLCAEDIPKALGIKHACTVERAHRLGILQTDRKTPRQVITRYLNDQDKADILRLFLSKRE